LFTQGKTAKGDHGTLRHSMMHLFWL